MLKRSIVFLYGVVCYAISLAVFIYMAGFIGNLFVPRSMDAPATGDFSLALIVDLALILVFAVQHSVMARPAFKRWWTRFVPEAAERSTYLLASNAAMILLFVFWRPLGGNIWAVEGTTAGVLYGLYAFGWALLLAATFFINHFDLFGLRQIWLYLRGREYHAVPFKAMGPYRLVRHPIYVGWLIIFWATPTMSGAHLLFAVATTIYILMAIEWEESDLLDGLGEAYRQYRRNVPSLIPFTGGKSAK